MYIKEVLMATFTEPQVHLWTRDEYYKMADAGLFEHRRVELIEGRIFDMSPMGSLHATAVALAAHTVEHVFTNDYFVRWQMPFIVSGLSEPEPDVAVVPGTIRDYSVTHPTEAALIIEVAETSLTYDRTEKVSLYAKADIAEYWIINLVEYQLEVYRQPMPDPTAKYGFTYATKIILTTNDSVTPLARPEAVIAVADLLP